MPTRMLQNSFYARPAKVVALELIGKTLVRQLGDQVIDAKITETEAYVGPHDVACHAHRGRTKRNEVMFGPAGIWYVYFVYGMHWMLNVVTDRDQYPAAVLFRAKGDSLGPGRLTKQMQIDRALNGLPATRKSGLWIEDRGVIVPRRKIRRTPRIGIGYAEEWTNKPYRFVLEE